MSTKQALNRATTKYRRENYDSFLLHFSKKENLKAKVKSHINNTGESMQSFIKRAIRETIENDNAKAHKS